MEWTLRWQPAQICDRVASSPCAAGWSCWPACSCFSISLVDMASKSSAQRARVQRSVVSACKSAPLGLQRARHGRARLNHSAQSEVRITWSSAQIASRRHETWTSEVTCEKPATSSHLTHVGKSAAAGDGAHVCSSSTSLCGMRCSETDTTHLLPDDTTLSTPVEPKCPL